MQGHSKLHRNPTSHMFPPLIEMVYVKHTYMHMCSINRCPDSALLQRGDCTVLWVSLSPSLCFLSPGYKSVGADDEWCTLVPSVVLHSKPAHLVWQRIQINCVPRAGWQPCMACKAENCIQRNKQKRNKQKFIVFYDCLYKRKWNRLGSAIGPVTFLHLHQALYKCKHAFVYTKDNIGSNPHSVS